MKVLITGASGSVGKYLATVLGADYDIVSIGRRDESSVTHVVDLGHEMDKMSAIFEHEKPDIVIHLASLIGKECEQNPTLAEKINVDVTRELAELAVEHGCKKFIFFSTAAVYAQNDLAPTKEDSNINPKSVYGQTKLKAEHTLAELAKKSKDTQFITLRPFNIYGPSFKRSLVNLLLESSENSPVNLYGFQQLYRDYVHISDVCQAVGLVIKQAFADPHTIINIASGVATSNKELVQSLVESGKEVAYTVNDQGEADISWADISLAKTIGFTPSSNLIIDQE